MSRSTSDEQLRQQVRDALAGDVLVDELQLDVEVDDAVVLLVGTVGSYAERLVAQHTARNVDGVHNLIDAIDVKPSGSMHPSDPELKRIVEQVLAWNALVPEQRIDVSVIDGLVALTGSCPSKTQAAEAKRAISHLSGVRGVVNRIDVDPSALTPDDIRKTIVEALRRRITHEAGDIDVIIDGSTVTLRGSLASPMEHRAVVGAVAHAPGVGDVRDELNITGHRD